MIIGVGFIACGLLSPFVQAQSKSAPCAAAMNFTLDDSDRTTRLEQMNSGRCVKETVRFSFAPAESGTFPFNGQTFSTADGVALTQMFQRNTRLDFSFVYSMGPNTLRINVERTGDINPATKLIKLLPARFSIDLNGNSAAFVFTGKETEEELETKAQEFLAIGHQASALGFDAASQRMTEFAKTLWGTFSLGEYKRVGLPLKAAFPATEFTINLYALSFALRDHAFETNRLVKQKGTLRQGLLLLTGVRERSNQDLTAFRKVSFSNAAPLTAQDEILPLDDEADYAGLCCRLCYAVHALLGLSELDCTCCLFSCKSCLPILTANPVQPDRVSIAEQKSVLRSEPPRTHPR
jgi:hypothetical protein